MNTNRRQETVWFVMWDELFDLLKEEGTMVESIDRITIDFEQVFIQIVKGGKTDEMAPLIQC